MPGNKLIKIFFVLTAAGLLGRAQTENLEHACDFIFERVSTIKSDSLNRQKGEFKEQGKEYSGCIINLKTSRTKTGDIDFPRSILHPNNDSAMLNHGWKSDLTREADGPDGTSFVIVKQNIFCLVEGKWDGGICGDSTYIPSDKVELTVSCSCKKEN
jgi:hypothetical protein